MTLTGFGKYFRKKGATARETTSNPPPGTAGTMQTISRSGYFVPSAPYAFSRLEKISTKRTNAATHKTQTLLDRIIIGVPPFGLKCQIPLHIRMERARRHVMLLPA